MHLVNGLTKSWLPARSLVETALKARFGVDQSGHILVLESFCPWQDHLFNLEKEENIPESEKPIYALFSETTSTGINWFDPVAFIWIAPFNLQIFFFFSFFSFYLIIFIFFFFSCAHSGG